MNTNENKKKDLTSDEKLDLIIEKLDLILRDKKVAALDEGPKDPPPTPPNP